MFTGFPLALEGLISRSDFQCKSFANYGPLKYFYGQGPRFEFYKRLNACRTVAM